MIPLRSSICVSLCLALGITLTGAWAADSAAPLLSRIDPAGIRGSLVLCGGGALPDEILQEFVRRAGGAQGRLVVIPTAGSDRGLSDSDRLLARWKDSALASVELLHTRSRDEANQAAFAEPLRRATAVWFSGGEQSRIAAAYVGTAVERELTALLDRGGVIGGTSAGAAVQSRRMIAGGNPIPRVETGFDLLPGTIVDQHFSQRGRQARLQAAVAESLGTWERGADGHGHWGLGIDEGTAVIVEGRRLKVVGTGQAWVCLPASERRPATLTELRPGEEADVTALRNAARARRQNEWPPLQPEPTVVPQGTLFIVGGGRLSRELVQHFLEAAGGMESLIVILPTASEAESPEGTAERQMLSRAGAKNLVVLPGRSVAEVESAEFLDTIARARGIWFGGGRQWRFVDAYAQTRALAAFRAVLERGGVIGGSSAGASIQADYLVRGSPLGNTVMMAEGYERGFGFLPGVAIDQHFTQRRRHADLEQFVRTYPQFLGIGIDESTALRVRGSTAEVVGDHSAWMYNRSGKDNATEVVQVKSGQQYDLRQRAVVAALPAE